MQCVTVVAARAVTSVTGRACRVWTKHHAACSRTISDFAYVRPGPVVQARHRVRWRESERYEVWKVDTIPYVDASLPDAAKGRVAAFWQETMTDIESRAERLQDTAKDVYIVASFRELLEKRGNGDALTADEWNALLAKPTEAEIQLLKPQEARMQSLLDLVEEAKQLSAALEEREQDAAESGEIDLSVPLLHETREQVQMMNNRDVLKRCLTLARKLSIVTAAMDADMSPRERAAIRNVLDNAHTGADYVRIQSTSSLDVDPSDDVVNRDMTPLQRANANHFTTYEEEREELLAHRDRTDVIPRRKLPTPLHADAPSRELEDVARVIDSNPSFTEADKKYILQHYTDAVTGKTEQAFDWSAEKKAIVDPQPQWDAYDPDKVKLQDDFIDAAKGLGKFSKMRGSAHEFERVNPSAVGELDVNPERRPLEASEEVQLAMAAYEKDVQQKVARITDSITAALSASMGVKHKPSTTVAAVGAAKQAQQPAQQAKPSAGKPDQKKPIPGVSKPAGMSNEDAAKVVESFFKRYLAGERVPVPSPPVEGPRRDTPAPAPAPAAAKGKDKAKGKK